MLDPAADQNPLPPLAAYRRMPYQKHHNHSDVYQPIGERFKHPDIAEPLHEIAN
jgi:hypothetical protein